MALIDTKDLWKTFEMGSIKVHALRGVSITIDKGDYVAIMGPSGSGKSTLMNLIGCLDTPSKGSYYLNGRLVSEMSDDELAHIRNKEIGFVFQTFKKALGQVDLSDRMTHKPNELSGGQRQRVAIARALVNEPSLILADEPTGNLDSKTSTEIMDLLSHLHAEGNTIIVVTHDHEVASFSQRVLHIRDGVIEKEEITGNGFKTANRMPS